MGIRWWVLVVVALGMVVELTAGAQGEHGQQGIAEMRTRGIRRAVRTAIERGWSGHLGTVDGAFDPRRHLAGRTLRARVLSARMIRRSDSSSSSKSKSLERKLAGNGDTLAEANPVVGRQLRPDLIRLHRQVLRLTGGPYRGMGRHPLKFPLMG
ncbi:hypothetical protein CBR_g30045 [Chara braunii]|uniref:Secreted protein n=1 Tax=Chara braunii TaxID=69332 RepID=A0A388LC64_CHABU|nr:hypothetical protein CBR_g30045 [Chara braunii]|eukprot:GBG79783.1 hypothetical protein CBR_g30045 [Chara braunii]